MKIARNWLQDYFDDPLPPAEELAELLTFHAFEIEGVEQVGDAWVIDVDVLANRGSDCLCHRGIARELATILGRAFADPLAEPLPEGASCDARIEIEAPELVNRFSIAEVRGVSVGPSPEWLRARLEALGQRSINNVVDATNYVMLSLGQPLHAFDADKPSGETKTLCVRRARAGESITTLTQDTYELSEETLLITDGSDRTPVAIAGIKGGAHAEVDANTRHLILEAANFNYVSVRKTSQRLKLATDASVRFQNQPAPGLTRYALRDVVALITKIAGGTYAGEVDWYPEPKTAPEVTVTLADVNALLGTAFTEDVVEEVLTRFTWTFARTGAGWRVTVPWERSDLRSTPDLVEEIGRIAGYGAITSAALAPTGTTVALDPAFALAERVRQALVAHGFSEILTYPLRQEGGVTLVNALGSDKRAVRDSLLPALAESLERNAYYAPLLGLSDVQLFEIGTVARGLTKDGYADERLMLALGVRLTKKRKGVNADALVAQALAHLEAHLGVVLGTPIEEQVREGVVEIDLAELLAQVPAPSHYPTPLPQEGGYTPASAYPFVLRDVAVWVPEGTAPEDVAAIIARAGGALLVRCDLFDEFTKDGRTSFAFHLVFQAQDRTLFDEEVGERMAAIERAFVAHSFEVR
ncbi:hypothetical protein GVX82_03510 [Patescibacteria group bacterium]|jgi:phenylalanyl-tRNA synthetase beta chain|nr:hypothetical protein [Patescibacteria group bacterium]